MPRPRQYDAERIATAARTVVASRGPSAATISAIASEIGAPTGSIYYRFGSRAELLATVWLDATTEFQAHFAQVVSEQGSVRALVEVTFDFCRRSPESARILLLHRIDDFDRPDWPDRTRERAARLEAELRDVLGKLSERFFGDASVAAIRRVVLAVCDLPVAAVRRDLDAGRPVDGDLLAPVARAAAAILQEVS